MHVDPARTLSASDFSSFFRDVHGYEPFPWQQRLTAQVLDRGEWPPVIDLPTGTGKTAVLDTAVFAMALRPNISPRRVVFVIDRRIVVDQVHKRAMLIKERTEAGTTPLLEQVRDRLHELSGGEALGVAALRGGIPVDNEWAQRPDQPWVVVSTVDQFGSRLLFRGYGVSPRMRPVHAGLAGNDCLVILDEVHLSSAFAETLAKAAELKPGPLIDRFAIVEMSATPTRKTSERFTLDTATDLEGCEELRRRVGASKQAEMLATTNEDSIPSLVLKQLKSIEKSTTEIRSIGVVVNRVRTARETSKLLADEGYTTHLLTGRMRPLDRVEVLKKIQPSVDPGRDRACGSVAVVVATQCIEVGADFSFDAMLVECAPVDSLRQRFGRLDRRGTYRDRAGGPAKAWVIGPRSVVASKRPDPIYGDSVRVTWQELERLGKHGPFDVGPMSLRDFPEGAQAPRALAPLLLPTHMDAWAQTCPEPLIDPPLDWFLHGIDETRPADVSILWRWDRTGEALRLVPPRQAEFLAVPIMAVRAWLSDHPEVDVADVSKEQPMASERVTADESPSRFLRWSGFADEPESIRINEICPGDILVVDPMLGGLRFGTWDPSDKGCVQDLGDAAQVSYGRRATLRLDARLFSQDRPPRPVEVVDRDVPREELIRSWLARRASDPDQPEWLRDALGRLGDDRFAVTLVGSVGDESNAAYYVLVEKHKAAKPVVDAALMDGADEASSLTGTGIRLDAHLTAVGERAAKTAERLGIPSEVVDDIRLAGRLHDLGKVDQRFQMRLVGWDSVEFEARRGDPLAKSLPNVSKVARPIEFSQGVSSYPRGMRHEVASVAMIESNAEVLGEAHDKDLVIHLVSTHHGWCRPLPPIVEDPAPQTLRYEIDDVRMEATSDLSDTSMAIEMAERFWRLTERYGYHGLAWLEAILRLADHQQSAEEAKRS